MNIRYYLTALFAFFYVFANAQDISFNVEETKASHSTGSHDGFVVNITQANVKNVQGAWEKMMNKQSENKAKVEDVKGEYIIKNALLEDLNDSPISVYALFSEGKNGGTKMLAFFEVDSVFINESNNSDVSYNAKKLMEDFAIESYKDAVKDELKEEEKKLKSLESDLKKLVNENEKMHKTISSNENDIESLDVDLDMNKKEYNPSYGETVAVYDSEGNEIDRAAAPKTVIKLDPEKKKELDKEQKKLSKKKYKLEAEIRKAEREIPLNLQDQEEKKLEIEKQEAVVEKVEKKLKAVNNINN
ncbi:hypothetical protein [Chondrinema litorale]|uniref:hypothetical protein n=1 Tax=Chondrinema litorale TaxID=2994555 RepID=UPI00254340DF|nr:hypothetical protein [Chondrinema litorale]UZR95421.1 hypothetical protein OQ292_06290 [Chondrinema litorale]